MAKALITYCDLHLAQEPEQYVVGTQHRIMIDGLRERTLDLCDECADPLLTTLRDVLQKHGQLVEGGKARPPLTVNSATKALRESRSSEPPVKRASPNEVPKYQHLVDGVKHETCLICGEDYIANGIAAHYLSKHKSTQRGKLLLEAGLVDRLYGCSAPGCSDAFPTETGRNQHEYRKHGITLESLAG